MWILSGRSVLSGLACEEWTIRWLIRRKPVPFTHVCLAFELDRTIRLWIDQQPLQLLKQRSTYLLGSHLNAGSEWSCRATPFALNRDSNLGIATMALY